jgi:hypothetical protein
VGNIWCATHGSFLIGAVAGGYGTERAAAISIISVDQSLPQSTSTPCSHFFNSGPNGCDNTAIGDGCIKDLNWDLLAALPVGVPVIRTSCMDGFFLVHRRFSSNCRKWLRTSGLAICWYCWSPELRLSRGLVSLARASAGRIGGRFGGALGRYGRTGPSCLT